jgi:predicted GIY-YIG superfamily endonuclease
MIRGMKSGGKKEWSVYVLRCGDGSLYTGIAKDVIARLARHNQGKGAAYTRSHLPVELVYKEFKLTRSGALIREAALKRLPRHKKESLLTLS